MNKKLFLILLALNVFISANGQNMEEKTVITYCSSTIMEKILDENGITYESIAINDYKIKLNDRIVRMNIADGDLFLHTYFSISNPSLNRLNDFNFQYRWGRLYIDGGGDLVYASELSFTGGIGVEGVRSFLSTYWDIIGLISDHMD